MRTNLFNCVSPRNITPRAMLKVLVLLALVQLLLILWEIPTVSQNGNIWLKKVRGLPYCSANQASFVFYRAGVQMFPYLRQPVSVPMHPVVCNTSAIWALNDSVVSVRATPTSWASLEANVTTNHPGGHNTPVSCDPQHRVAIVIPYRDRESQLLAFLQHMHPFLQRQQIEYRIYVVELVANITFNRALLMNVGFVEANKGGNFTCYIFHDVDLLPEDIRNLYICQDQPRHLSVAIDMFNYRLPYKSLLGGACAFTERQFRTVNGCSNLYFGWGGEDDDLFRRTMQRELKVTRYPENIARYKMSKIMYSRKSISESKTLLVDAQTRMDVDGLNTLKYTVLQKRNEPLYTWILVSVDTRLYENSAKNSTTSQSKPINGTEASVNRL